MDAPVLYSRRSSNNISHGWLEIILQRERRWERTDIICCGSLGRVLRNLFKNLFIRGHYSCPLILLTWNLLTNTPYKGRNYLHVSRLATFYLENEWKPWTLYTQILIWLETGGIKWCEKPYTQSVGFTQEVWSLTLAEMLSSDLILRSEKKQSQTSIPLWKMVISSPL